MKKSTIYALIAGHTLNFLLFLGALISFCMKTESLANWFFSIGLLLQISLELFEIVKNKKEKKVDKDIETNSKVTVFYVIFSVASFMMSLSALFCILADYMYVGQILMYTNLGMFSVIYASKYINIIKKMNKNHTLISY